MKKIALLVFVISFFGTIHSSMQDRFTSALIPGVGVGSTALLLGSLAGTKDPAVLALGFAAMTGLIGFLSPIETPQPFSLFIKTDQQPPPKEPTMKDLEGLTGPDADLLHRLKALQNQ
jgi:hypothetical protein